MFFYMTECHAVRPVFGRSLESHLKQTEREISVVIQDCINILHHEALEEEVDLFIYLCIYYKNCACMYRVN